MYYMGLRDRWCRFNQWVVNLSRFEYALFGVVAGSLAAGATTVLFTGEISFIHVVSGAIVLGAGNYVWGSS
jgi:hypothetical protein